MEISELKLLRNQLKNGFYNRLINGDIKKAKITLEFIFKSFNELNKLIPQIVLKLDAGSAKQLAGSWQALKIKFYEFQALTEKELNITEELFNKDPAVWKELLSSIFKSKVNELCSLLQSTDDLFKAQAEVKEQLPCFKYSPKYAKQKERNNLYSQYENMINRMESKLQIFIAESIKNKGKIIEKKGISKVIQTGGWKGCYHANLSKPLNDHRIVYSFDGKTVKFEIIGTHKQLGID